MIDLATGQDVDLAEQLAPSGPTVLWFWTTESGESAAEAAAVAKLAADFSGRLKVVTVGTGGDAQQAEQFQQEAGLAGVTTVWDPAAQSFEHYQVSAIPSIIAMDDAGNVMGRWNNLSPEVIQFLDVAA